MPSLQVQVETLKLHTHLVTALTELDQEQVTEGLSTRSGQDSSWELGCGEAHIQPGKKRLLILVQDGANHDSNLLNTQPF